MSGGLHAIKGFSYQANVILDHLLPFFDEYGSSCHVRPEGIEDLDLFWFKEGREYRKYIQIKKPKEDKNANRTSKPWSLLNAICDLLPNAIKNLEGNLYVQSWVLGDEVTTELQALVDSGVKAHSEQTQIYLLTLHRLALDKTIKKNKIKQEKIRQHLYKFKVGKHSTPDEVKFSFQKVIVEVSAPDDLYSDYQKNLDEMHIALPSILSRITIDTNYGTEEEVEERVFAYLQENYKLPFNVVKETLHHNLKGFIEEVSKYPNWTFNQEDFEIKLRCIWPTMVPVRLPPNKGNYHIDRPDLVKNIISSENSTSIEVIGASGSGKTMLAAELLARISHSS